MRPDVRVGRDVSCGSIEDVWVMPDRPSDPPEDQGGTPVPRPSAARYVRRFCASDRQSSSSLPVPHPSVPVRFSPIFSGLLKTTLFARVRWLLPGAFGKQPPQPANPLILTHRHILSSFTPLFFFCLGWRTIYNGAERSGGKRPFRGALQKTRLAVPGACAETDGRPEQRHR